jgi:K+-sensing histidine kinase KdpD
LLITRLKTKHGELKKIRINLEQAVTELLESFKTRTEQGKITITRKNSVPGKTIEGEEELIRKCLGNILDNAFNYTPSGGIIEILHYEKNNDLICEINNSGKGFSKSDDLLFELFTTGDDYKDNRIGIGLPIAKMIMEAHNGSIKIGNKPEGGAQVKLIFRKE